MWCARPPLPRPDDTVVVCAGRNWAAYWSPFFFLCCFGFCHTEVIKNLSERYMTFALAAQ